MAKQDATKLPVEALVDKQAKAEHARLHAELLEHDRRYYQDDKPTVTDAEYDALHHRRVGQAQLRNGRNAAILRRGRGRHANEDEAGEKATKWHRRIPTHILSWPGIAVQRTASLRAACVPAIPFRDAKALPA